MDARRVVLVGFMASGKTEVGERLARRLGWSHIDIDREIEREQGSSIAEIFEARGESGFRALETSITPRLVAREEVVVSTGGGWITNEGLLERLPNGTLTVWLTVSPDEILRRVSATSGQSVRPLLQTPDPRGRVETLLASREPLYQRADAVIPTDGRPLDAVVDSILHLLQARSSADSSPSSNSQHGSQER